MRAHSSYKETSKCTMSQRNRKQTSIPSNDHWTFFSVSPFGDPTSSLRRLWLKRRIRAPGTRAMHAMPSSCSRRSHDTKSSSDATSDSITPVWTQMKLYGRRPAKADEGKRDLTTCLVFDQMPIFTVLTNKDWAEEKCDGNVDDGSRHVEKPVGSHGEESQEEQKEEQTILVVLNLEDIRKMVLCACIKV